MPDSSSLPRFRVDPETKAPLTIHGFKDASTIHQDPLTAGEWGIPTGRATGVFVLDVDCYKPAGAEWLTSQAPILATVPYATTRNGGRHYFYRWESEEQTNGKVCPGVDLRGEGGYVVYYGWWPADPAQLPTMPLVWWHREQRPHDETWAPADYGDVDWAGLLEPHGWYRNGQFWVHPESSNHRTATITTHGNLYMHGTTCHPFESGESYTPWKAFELLNPARRNPYARHETEPPVADPGPDEGAWEALMATERLVVEPPATPNGNGHSLPPADFLVVVQEFPLEVFPPVIMEFIEQTAASVCVGIEAVATCVLPILATALGSSRWIDVKGDYQERPGFYVGLVAESGRRKTPAIKHAVNPLERIQAELFDDWKGDLAEWRKLPTDLRKKQRMPELRSLLLKDVTVESVGKALQSHERGSLLVRDELAGWAKSFGQYKQGKGDDRQKWLEMWSGSSLLILRSKAEPIVVPHPFMCVLGGIQPAVFEVLRTEDDGLAERFLYDVMPEVPERADTPSVDKRLRGRYEGIVREMYALEPKALSQDLDGTDRLTAARQLVLDQKADPSLPPPLRSYWGKGEGYLSRLAVVLAATWYVGAGELETLSVSIVERAERLLQFYQGQATVLFGNDAILAPREFDRAGPRLMYRLAEWVTSQGGEATLRDAICNGPLRRVRRDEALQLTQDAAARGLVTTVNGRYPGAIVLRTMTTESN